MPPGLGSVVGWRDSAEVEVTGGGVSPGLGSGVGTRSSLLLLTAVSVPETKIRTEVVSVRDKDRGTGNCMDVGQC